MQAADLMRRAVDPLQGLSAVARDAGICSTDVENALERLGRMEEGGQGDAHEALRHLTHEVLPRFAGLAAAVQRCVTPTPEAAQLQLAQAAAARSCAYLRCTNLGGEGGPAAGQGIDSQRCWWVVRLGQDGHRRLMGLAEWAGAGWTQEADAYLTWT